MQKKEKFSKNSEVNKKFLRKKNHGFLKEKRRTLRKNSIIASD